MSQTSLMQQAPLHMVHGIQRAVFECALPEACTGDPLKPCTSGYTGPLCNVCAEDFSRPGFKGACTPCDESLGAVWLVLPTLLACVAFGGLVYWVLTKDRDAGLLIDQAQLLKELSLPVKTLLKTLTGFLQVLTQIEFTLQLVWPGNFHGLLDSLRIASFDFLQIVDLGCVASPTYYSKFRFAAAILPVLVAIVISVYGYVVFVQTGESDRTDLMNRCSRLVLLVIFSFCARHLACPPALLRVLPTKAIAKHLRLGTTHLSTYPPN